VLRSAPENLAAIRGLADIHHKRGALGDALTQYRTALNLARNDPDLEDTVTGLTRQLEPVPRPDARPIGPAGSTPDDNVLMAELTLFTDAHDLGRLGPVDAAQDPAHDRALLLIERLEQWLTAIHVARAQRIA